MASRGRYSGASYSANTGLGKPAAIAATTAAQGSSYAGYGAAAARAVNAASKVSTSAGAGTGVLSYFTGSGFLGIATGWWVLIAIVALCMAYFNGLPELSILQRGGRQVGGTKCFSCQAQDKENGIVRSHGSKCFSCEAQTGLPHGSKCLSCENAGKTDIYAHPYTS